MTFPRVASKTTAVAASGASTVMPMPPGIMVGDLLLLIAATRTAAITAITISAGWTAVDVTSGLTPDLGIYARIATGTTADAATVTKASDDFTCTVLRIVDHGVVSIASDIKIATQATGASTAPNSPSLNAGSTDDWLWLSIAAQIITTSTHVFTGFPANYVDLGQLKSASSTTALITDVLHRQLNGSTEDPGAFTSQSALGWQAQTIGIKPGTTSTEARISDVVTASSSTVNCTTPSFTPPADCVLVASCCVGNLPNTGTQTCTLTDSLGSTWTALDSHQAQSGYGLVKLFAMNVGASPAARTVTLAGVNGTNDRGVLLTVYALQGTEPTASILGNTFHGAANVSSGTLNVGSDGSLILSAISDSAQSGTITASTNGVIDVALSEAGNVEKHAIGHWFDQTTTGNKTVSFTAGTVSNGSMAAWEIKKAVSVSVLANQYWGVKV